MKMTETELSALIEREFQGAMGAPGGDISTERAAAWDFYLSKLYGNEIEGQSEVVTSDVADVIDGAMPSLLRMFTTADNLVSFDPVGKDDIEKAEQESDYVNYVFFKQNPAFLILYTWFFDALVQKNGIVKAWWDESERVTQEAYQGLTAPELGELFSDEELDPVERAERIAETIDPQTGQIVQGTVYDIVFKRVCKRGQVRIENVPPEEYRISSDARSLDPSDARMVGHERLVKRSDLLDMGFDPKIVDTLPADVPVNSGDERKSRRDKSDDEYRSQGDRSQDEITVREAFMRVDYDGDGRSELRQVVQAGGKILQNEIADRAPFHVISPQPLPHKHFGRATAEKVMDVQLVNSTLTRQILDNLYHTNRPGHAVWEQGMTEDTLDDLLTTRVGRIARFARPVSEAYQPLTVPFTAAATFPMLEYFDKMKRERTGISSDAQGLSPDQLKNIQQSVLMQGVDMGRMKLEAIARIFAETGIKSLLLHVHELLLKHQDKGQIVRLRNKWVDVNPKEWRTRLDMTINIGLGIGTREQNLLHLNAIWEKQAAIVQNGGMGTLVTTENIYNTVAEIVKNANLKNPEMFFTPVPNEQLAQMQQQNPQEELLKIQQQVEQGKLQLAQMRLELDKTKALGEFELEKEKIQQKYQEMEDKLLTEMEWIKNELTKIDVQTPAKVEGSRVER